MAATTIVGGIAGRYATALFELGRDNNALDALADDLETLGVLLAENDDLIRLVRSPVINRADQARGMDAVLEKAGAHPITQKFVGVVAGNGRLFALPDMVRGFARLLADHRGEISGEVVSAQPLSDGQIDNLKAQLSKALGQDVHLDAKVDESLLGGLTVKVGSRMIDSSLRTKLENLRFAMRGTG